MTQDSKYHVGGTSDDGVLGHLAQTTAARQDPAFNPSFTCEYYLLPVFPLNFTGLHSSFTTGRCHCFKIPFFCRDIALELANTAHFGFQVHALLTAMSSLNRAFCRLNGSGLGLSIPSAPHGTCGREWRMHDLKILAISATPQWSSEYLNNLSKIYKMGQSLASFSSSLLDCISLPSRLQLNTLTSLQSSPKCCSIKLLLHSCSLLSSRLAMPFP